MPVLIPRIRTIGVRLSEKEYAALEKFSLETGARSMSDVARAAISRFVLKPGRDSSLLSTLENAQQLRDLEHKVLQLTAEISLLKADREPEITEQRRDCTE